MAYCLQYYVRLNDIGAPQGSTMMGFKKNNPPCDSFCQWAPLQTTPYITPPGMQQCNFPGGIRYFYRISSRTGHIVPNSMFESLHYPKRPKNNENCIIEFKRYCSN